MEQNENAKFRNVPVSLNAVLRAQGSVEQSSSYQMITRP